MHRFDSSFWKIEKKYPSMQILCWPKYFEDFSLKSLLITFEVIQKAYKFEEIFNIASSKYIAAAIHINFCKSFANRFLKSWS